MITENIILREDYKKQLKHLSIDTDIHVSSMLINSAKYILHNNKDIQPTLMEMDAPFTMRIEKDLKKEIKEFCKDKQIRIKDFWNEAAYIAIDFKGDFNNA